MCNLYVVYPYFQPPSSASPSDPNFRERDERTGPEKVQKIQAPASLPRGGLSSGRLTFAVVIGIVNGEGKRGRGEGGGSSLGNNGPAQKMADKNFETQQHPTTTSQHKKRAFH